MFVAMDANFRMKRKKVSSEKLDPSLTGGCGYFVEEEGYQAHLKLHTAEKQDVSTLLLKRVDWLTKFQPSMCVSHDAVNSADTKETRGLHVTGIGAVDCARHDFRRPNGVGDLQKGER